VAFKTVPLPGIWERKMTGIPGNANPTDVILTQAEIHNSGFFMVQNIATDIGLRARIG